MKVHDCKQGTPEWSALRAGIPTASSFDNIITPTGKASTSRTKYMHTLLAERMMGRPIVPFTSSWMDRGQTLEAEACAYYESMRELDTEKVGFVTNDEGTIGASPDRFVGDRGLLELKCPSEHVHVGYLLTKSVAAAYYPQAQGQLWVTEREWSDVVSYHPDLPHAIIRVERDEKFIATLKDALGSFVEELERLTAIARERRWIRKRRGVSASLFAEIDEMEREGVR